jgi:exodeoxyribonuclease VII small subunit
MINGRVGSNGASSAVQKTRGFGGTGRTGTMSQLPADLSFEQAMQRLEAIVEAMQSGRIGIEESLTRYEEAMALAAHCRQVLDTAEQKIQKIQFDSGGTPKLSPFAAPEPDSTATEA